MNNVCLSGGAPGSDMLFGECAHAVGHQVVHYSFTGHRPLIPHRSVLSHIELVVADPYLTQANQTLKRMFPTGDYFVNCLLRRNWYQVRNSQAVYAVAGIRSDGTVLGGAAWAVQMFVDMNWSPGKPLPLYVYDTKSHRWVQWKDYTWIGVTPPYPEGVYAGIGTRVTTPKIEVAIHKLYGINWIAKS